MYYDPEVLIRPGNLPFRVKHWTQDEIVYFGHHIKTRSDEGIEIEGHVVGIFAHPEPGSFILEILPD